MVNLAINGICGKMGKRILRLAQKDNEIKLVIGFEQKKHPRIGKEVEGVEVSSDYAKIKQCENIIDFSAPAATIAMLEKAKEAGKSMVIGTTSLNKEEEEIVEDASKTVPVIYSPNMSIGVNLFFKVLKLSASILKEYEVSIKEAHHIHKKDAPSGTAKKLAQIINDFSFNLKLEDIESKREGEIVGDHEVLFESKLDAFKIIHQAKSRDIFAQGAITAAKWVKGKPAGLYSMEDVLFGG